MGSIFLFLEGNLLVLRLSNSRNDSFHDDAKMRSYLRRRTVCEQDFRPSHFGGGGGARETSKKSPLPLQEIPFKNCIYKRSISEAAAVLPEMFFVLGTLWKLISLAQILLETRAAAVSFRRQMSFGLEDPLDICTGSHGEHDGTENFVITHDPAKRRQIVSKLPET